VEKKTEEPPLEVGSVAAKITSPIGLGGRDKRRWACVLFGKRKSG
jgi:hypothetical protein